MSIEKNKWVKVTTSKGNVYYTNDNTSGKTTPFLINDGEKHPTPKEILTWYESKKDDEDSFYDSDLGLSKAYKGADKGPLPPGVYMHRPDFYPNPERLVVIKPRNEKYVDIGAIDNSFAEDLKNFMESEQVYRDLGFIYKRGYGFYGDPGNGKSSAIRHMLLNTLSNEFVIIYLREVPSTEFLDNMKRSLGDVLKVFILEEITNMVGDASESLLNFVDGEQTLDRSIFLFTTNYPEKLPGNIVDRPSRFDKLYQFGNPNNDSRKKLLESFLKRDISEIDVKSTDGFSVAAIKELAILVLTQKISVEEGVKSLTEHQKLVKKNFAKSGPKLGFH